MFRSLATAILIPLTIGACATAVQTNPSRTATEELLISTAADRAAERLTLPDVKGAKVFVDATNFEGYDSKYAIGAIKESLLRQGAHLVDSKDKADTVVAIRAGALSTDQKSTLFGIPSFNVPIPFAGKLPFPEIAFYKTQVQEGVAKFAVTSYDAKDGALVGAADPQYGFSHNTKKTVLVFFSWTTNDAMPDDAKDSG
jgi:hypothetical protein